MVLRLLYYVKADIGVLSSHILGSYETGSKLPNYHIDGSG